MTSTTLCQPTESHFWSSQAAQDLLNSRTSKRGFLRSAVSFNKLRKRKRAKWLRLSKMLTCNQKEGAVEAKKSLWLILLILDKIWRNKKSSNNHQNINISNNHLCLVCVCFEPSYLWCSEVTNVEVKSTTAPESTCIGQNTMTLDIGRRKSRMKIDERWWKLLKFHDFDHLLSSSQLCTDHLVQLFEPGGSVRVGLVCFEVVVLYTDSRGPFGDPSGRTRLERVTGCDVTLMEPLERLEAKNFDENPKKIIKIPNLHMLYTMKQYANNIQTYTDIV